MSTKRSFYPLCPVCGGPVAGAMMTSHAIYVDQEHYYHPNGISVYCVSAECNYDALLATLTTPVPQEEP